MRFVDRAALGIADALVALARRLGAGSTREWLDALDAELFAIDSGPARLAWALGGLRVAWAMNGRHVVARLRPWAISVAVLGLAILLVPARLPLLIAAVMIIAVGSVAMVKAVATGSVALVLKSPAFGISFAVLAGLLVYAAAAAVSAVTQTDTQCTTTHAPASQPPASLVSAADFLAQGDYEYDRGACNEAIVDYTRAIELEPQSAAAYNDRAYTAMRLQNYSAALEDLNRAIELRPDYANALMNRGDIYNYYYAIDRQRAIADYDRVIALGATAHSSVCGHRMLAYYNGWSPRVYVEVLLHGLDFGCTLG